MNGDTMNQRSTAPQARSYAWGAAAGHLASPRLGISLAKMAT
jgi:hypothetical protein